METKPFRVRLKFHDSVLTDYLKSERLKRSWVLVQPEHQTISDLSSYLLRAFSLSGSCPHGIFLSVKGFALPHFESTAILNGTDVVRVRRKGSQLCLERNVGGFQNKVQTDLLDEENVPNGGVTIKKRKASKQLKNSRKKSKHSDRCLENGYYQKSRKRNQYQVHNQLCNNTVCQSNDPDGNAEASVLRKKKSQGKGLEGDSENQVVPVVTQRGHVHFTAHENGLRNELYRSIGLNHTSTSTSENGSKDGREEAIAAENAKKAGTLKEGTRNIQKRRPANFTPGNCSKHVWEETSAQN